MESLVNGVKGVHNNRVVVEIFEHACKFTPWYDPTLITPAIGPTPRLFRLKIIRRGAPLYPVLVRSFLRGWTRHGRLRDTTKLPRYFNPVEVEEEDGLLRSTCLPYAGKEGKRERERDVLLPDSRMCASAIAVSCLVKEQGALGVLEAWPRSRCSTSLSSSLLPCLPRTRTRILCGAFS